MAENGEKLELPHENIKKKLDEIIRSEGLVNFNIEISSGSKKGDNYAGILYRIVVTGSKVNGEQASLNLFCKVPVEMEGMRGEDKSIGVFIRENKFYNEILKEIKQFEGQKLVKDGFTSYAKCFATSSVTFEEFLIMEDLTKRKFAMFDRRKLIDLKHASLVMKALGKLHGASFALRDQKPEIIEKYSTELCDLIIVENQPWSPLFKNFVDFSVQKCVDKLKFEGSYQRKWEFVHTNFYDLMNNCCNTKLAEPYAAVTHGDCWNNNMMFKYENGLPTEVCLLDWQITRYSSPILDLTYYIFSTTEKLFRDVYYNTLLNIYHDSLSSYLKDVGSDPEKLFSYSEFQKELIRVGKYGLLQACLTIPLLVMDKEDAMDFENLVSNMSTSGNETMKTDELWTTRVADVLRDVVDLGYLE